LGNKTIAKVAVSAATYWVDRPYDYIVPDHLAERVSPGVRVMVPFSRGNRKTEGIVLALSSESRHEALKSVESVLDEAPVLSQEQIKLALWMRERFFCTVYEAVKAMLPAGLWYSITSEYRVADGYDREKAYEAAGRSQKEQQVLDVVFAHGGACSLKSIENAFGDQDPGPALSSLVKKGVLLTDSRETRRVRDKTVNTASLSISAEEALVIANQKRRRSPQQAAVLELLASIERAAVKEICYFTGTSAATVRRLAEAGLLTIEADEVFRRPTYRTGVTAPLPELNRDQERSFHGLLELAASGEPGVALLFGVTGSGKTAVYVRLIDEMLRRGKSSILLVPEISLTPQMLQTFSSYFGDNIAVLHSSLAIGERYDEWKRIKAGMAKVVIGTRSAVFAPVSDLGIIIIDEEQEDTYKSENSPRYHARDVAKYRCYHAGALLLLGSATPDVVSRYNAQTGTYKYFTLPTRYNLMKLPEVRIVDMKRELRQGNGGAISSVLREELEKNIARGEQSILFINRRGASKLITCVECGYTYKCSRCSVNLTYHSANKRLMCHYCGLSLRAEEYCPDCGGKLSFIGAGTQKVEEELKELFPGVEILRMDTDTVAPAGSHEALLTRFQEKKIPIMVGTQMVTKGLNFENVTLVGVISADQSLYSGDYRSGERTFSLITQVIGRGGRGDRPGRAIIQTFTPSNQTILQAASQDYESFYASEIQLRQLQNSPPFADLYVVTATGLDESQVIKCCAAIRAIFQKELGGRKDVRILGPAPLPVVRVNNRYRYRVTLSCKGDKIIRQLVSSVLIHCNTRKEFRGVSVFADVNPIE